MKRTKWSPEQLYRNHEQMINHRAHSFCCTTGHSFDEMKSVANWAFMRAIPRWKPHKGPFGTWLYRYITLRLIDYVKRTDLPLSKSKLEDLIRMSGCPGRVLHIEDTIKSQYNEYDPVLASSAMDLIASLSKEAREVVSILLTNPTEVLDLIGDEPPRIVRGILKEYLHDQGWSFKLIWKTFRELKEAMRC